MIAIAAKNFLNLEFQNNFVSNYLLGLYGNFTYFFMSTLFIVLTPIALIFENFNFIHYSIFIYIIQIALIFLFVNFYISNFNSKTGSRPKVKYLFFLSFVLFFYFSYHFFFYKISGGHHLLGTFFLYILIFYFNQQYLSKKMIIYNENYKFYFLYIATIFSNYTNVFILFVFFIFYLILEIFCNKKIFLNKSRVIFFIINIIFIVVSSTLIYFYNKFKPGEASYILATYGSISPNFINDIFDNFFVKLYDLVKILFDGYGILIFLSFIWIIKEKKNIILKILFISFCFLFVFYPPFLSAYQRTIIYFIPLLILFSFCLIESLLSKKILINLIIFSFITFNISWASYPILTLDKNIRNHHFYNFSTSSIGNTIECVKDINESIDEKKVLFLENNIKDLFTNLIEKNDNFLPITSRLAYQRIKNENI